LSGKISLTLTFSLAASLAILFATTSCEKDTGSKSNTTIYIDKPNDHTDRSVVEKAASVTELVPLKIELPKPNFSYHSSGLGFGRDKHYVENYEGKLVDARGITARYVRFYSNGSSMSEMNHYAEVEVYGKPAM